MSHPDPHPEASHAEDSQPENRRTPKISMVWLAIPLVLVFLAMVALQPNSGPQGGQDGPAIGKPAPQLDLILLSGQPSLESVDDVAGGEVTLIHFWATWCGPCKVEYPELAEMALRWQSDPRFRFVPVSCEDGRGETFAGLWDKTFRYFESAGINSVAFADPQRITRSSAAERLERGSLFFPTSIVIGLDGKIAGVWEGYTPESVEQIERLIDHLLDS